MFDVEAPEGGGALSIRLMKRRTARILGLCSAALHSIEVCGTLLGIGTQHPMSTTHQHEELTMTDTMQNANAVRALTDAEIGIVSGAGGTGSPTFSVATLERIALRQRLTESLLSHREGDLGDAIRDRIAGFGR